MARDVMEDLRGRAVDIWRANGLLAERVEVWARALSPREALGDPGSDDYPLVRGRERLMEAAVLGARGQAFSDSAGGFSGSLAEIAAMPLGDNFRRAVFVSALNASLRALKLCAGTVHCRDQGPAECAALLAAHLSGRFPGARVVQVGLQPRFVEALARQQPLRVLDLDVANIGQEKQGVRIEGPEAKDDALAWAEVLLVTGSALCNGSLGGFLADKPLVVFGVTAAGAAALLGWERFCALSA